MMEQVALIENAKTDLVGRLSESVKDSFSRLSYLLEVHEFSEEEVELNKTTLLWPKQLDPIFIENERVS